MALSDAYVRACCDKCGEDSDELELTALAQRGSWDERSIKSQLKRAGWIMSEDETTICPDCAEA